MNISSNFRLVFLAATCGSLLVGTVSAQVIPNPLMRPNRTQSATPPAGTSGTPDPQARGATAAPSRAGARGSEGEGLPTEQEQKKTAAEQLAGLYVSTVIGDRAVLRSTEARTQQPLAANTGGLNAMAGGGGGGAGGAAAGGGGGATGGAGGIGVGGQRTQVYVVRNGEVLPFLDKLRLLVRVRDTTVTLFDVTDIPPGNYDPLDLMDRGFPVAFRGTVDSVQSLPPTPPGLIGPGQGIDGAAFDRGRNTSTNRNSGIGAATGGGAATGTGGNTGTGNP